MDLVGPMKAVYVDASTRGMCELENFESHYPNIEFWFATKIEDEGDLLNSWMASLIYVQREYIDKYVEFFNNVLQCSS